MKPSTRCSSWNIWDLPFDRTPEGKISQRPFGGHTNNETGKPVRRAAHAADRTGHMILQTLYQQCLKNKVNFFDEFQVLDFLIVNGKTAGVVAVELATGELHTFHAKAVIFATGGHGRIFEVTSNAYAYTGDGAAVLLRRGLPLEDMEFFQFHPTGIYKLGILITEGRARRRRHPDQRQGRTLHAEVRADRQRPGLTRCRLAGDLYRDPRGTRRER